MSGHTPGPWAVCHEPPNEYWHAGVTIGAADPGDARRVCDVHTGGLRGAEIQPMHAANARLIAAAPELLAALVALQRLAASFGVPIPDAVPAAIARATQPLTPTNEES